MKRMIYLVFIISVLVSTSTLLCEEENTSRQYQEGSSNINPTDDLEVESMQMGITVEDMVNLLVGPNNSSVEIQNMNYTGHPIASGVFRGARDEGLEIDDGVILSSGFATNIYGPNNNEGITGMNSMPGSQNLNMLIPGYSTNDASVLEFDFIPKYNSIGFTYIFGSDEYLEWVGSNYNDVFGLFIDYQNIAIIPGTDVPVSINNVNPYSYSEYYADNSIGSGNFNVEADGMTVAVSVSRLIEPDVSHHISFEVADAGDFVLDSWVFLEAGSFASVQCSTYFEVIIVEGTELETPEDEELEIHAIARAEDAANFTWTLHPPQNGTVEFVAEDLAEEERTILYTPNEDYNGGDYFVLTVTDGLGGIINRFIEIEVMPVRDAPVNDVLPYIWGDFNLDGEVYCNPGLWNDDIDNQYAPPGVWSTISHLYQWQCTQNGIMDWYDIENATDSTFVITENETGRYIRCLVYAIDTGIGMGNEDTTIIESNAEYCNGPAGLHDLIIYSGITNIFPNPFNPTTNISYQLKNDSDLKITIFNSKGQVVKDLIDNYVLAGNYDIEWNGKDNDDNKCSSGIYLVKMNTDEKQF
ncbi:MAG: choice-of-anchor L domain-containing protein [Candidatus Cloacimonetes bacterium]|nr:choice-of-anchor L domain-containing protein [Candidatus Cloacimonadota bacterium]MCF7815017.1 choice-of-anchor L domain-containing protein [Candidatus Cloacimonadota bacterium]MCF7859935.1 choice-of-anchor L domain-containing protein [Candidatus Cloacimonadota bacterium]MCF7869262.1 choice-of-anchor L domain-containing protein [Candidatus Cloacimonadota bacterium]